MRVKWMLIFGVILFSTTNVLAMAKMPSSNGYSDEKNDNCPGVENPTQKDWNKDGIGDACQDTDNDGYLDYEELTNMDINEGGDSLSPYTLIVDNKKYKVVNQYTGKQCIQIASHTDPAKVDTDGDGLSDFCENWFPNHTDPVNPDSDCDGINDGLEFGLKPGELVKDCYKGSYTTDKTGNAFKDLKLIFGESNKFVPLILHTDPNMPDIDADQDGVADKADPEPQNPNVKECGTGMQYDGTNCVSTESPPKPDCSLPENQSKPECAVPSPAPDCLLAENASLPECAPAKKTCGANEQLNDASACVCAEGFGRYPDDPSSVCVACGTHGNVVGGYCKCENSFHNTLQGDCVSDALSCDDENAEISNGQCNCMVGYGRIVAEGGIAKCTEITVSFDCSLAENASLPECGSSAAEIAGDCGGCSYTGGEPTAVQAILPYLAIALGGVGIRVWRKKI